MPVYDVIRKADRAAMTRYCSSQAREFINGTAYPLAEFDHIEYVEDAVALAPTSIVLTKREFIKRLTVEEYATIKVAAQANATLDYYWQMFMLAEEINTGDADTIAGVTMLEQAGLIGTGRAGEILNG